MLFLGGKKSLKIMRKSIRNLQDMLPGVCCGFMDLDLWTPWPPLSLLSYALAWQAQLLDASPLIQSMLASLKCCQSHRFALINVMMIDIQVSMGRFFRHQTSSSLSISGQSEWGSPSASDPRAKNMGQRATKGTVLTSQSLSPLCDCRRLGARWRLGVGRI